MREYHGLIGIDAARQVVHDHVVDVVLDMLGSVAVRDDLVVCDDDVGVDAHVLQAHALDQRAEVMPQVQPARRTVAGQHRVLVCLAGVQVCLDLVAAAQRRLIAALIWHRSLPLTKKRA